MNLIPQAKGVGIKFAIEKVKIEDISDAFKFWMIEDCSSRKIYLESACILLLIYRAA